MGPPAKRSMSTIAEHMIKAPSYSPTSSEAPGTRPVKEPEPTTKVTVKAEPSTSMRKAVTREGDSASTDVHATSDEMKSGVARRESVISSV